MKHLPTTLLATLATAAIVASGPASAEKSRPSLERLPAASLNGKPLPFSAAVRAGDMLYLSGQVGIGSDGKLPPGFEAQARLALDNIGGTLKTAGLSWKDVVRCMVLLGDIANWPKFNEVYLTYVDPAHLPARSALATSGLAMGALIEVQCEAYDPQK